MKFFVVFLLIATLSPCLTADVKIPLKWIKKLKKANAEAKVTLKVVDEREIPVEGATVIVGFKRADSFKEDYAEGESNKNGLFSAEGISASCLIGYRV